MNAKDVLLLEAELDYYISGFEDRLNEVGQPKLTLHTGVAKDIFTDIKVARKSKEKKIYSELMQIEEIVRKIALKRAKEFPKAEIQSEVSDDSKDLLNRIYRLKGMVSLICLFLIPLMLLAPAPRRLNSRRLKIERIKMEVGI